MHRSSLAAAMLMTVALGASSAALGAAFGSPPAAPDPSALLLLTNNPNPCVANEAGWRALAPASHSAGNSLYFEYNEYSGNVRVGWALSTQGAPFFSAHARISTLLEGGYWFQDGVDLTNVDQGCHTSAGNYAGRDVTLTFGAGGVTPGDSTTVQSCAMTGYSEQSGGGSLEAGVESNSNPLEGTSTEVRGRVEYEAAAGSESECFDGTTQQSFVVHHFIGYYQNAIHVPANIDPPGGEHGTDWEPYVARAPASIMGAELIDCAASPNPPPSAILSLPILAEGIVFSPNDDLFGNGQSGGFGCAYRDGEVVTSGIFPGTGAFVSRQGFDKVHLWFDAAFVGEDLTLAFASQGRVYYTYWN